jgi:hypothetical protein
MILKPVKKVIDRPIGYAQDSETVIGEWSGTRWADVPRKAHLYANNAADLRPRYQTGDLEARRWVRGTRSGYGRITGWTWNGPHGVHTITNLRGDMNRVPIPQRFQVLDEWASYMRSFGANVSSPSSTVSSVIRAGLDAPVYLAQDEDLPTDQLCRGSRIEHKGGVRAEFGHSYLWDIASAFPAALISLRVPNRRWREYPMGPRSPIPTDPGFGHAVVHVPSMPLGPLPDKWNPIRLRFPTDDVLEGIWSLDELREAERVGCRVMLMSVWVSRQFATPFAEFGQLLADMRNNLSEGALRIAKRGANGQVGTFAREGHQLRSRYINGIEEVWEYGGHCKPKGLGIHAQITGAVRSKLFGEGIAPNAEQFVSCHTDGVILQVTDTQLLGTGCGIIPGDWDIKRDMEKVYLLDAQRYAWEDSEGTHYSVAGIPSESVERFFMRKWADDRPLPGPYSRKGNRTTLERRKRA